MTERRGRGALRAGGAAARRASARSRRCGTRQQKMAGAELGDRDAFGLKVGPAGAVVQVFQMRGGRVVERIELVSDAGADRRRRRADAPRPTRRKATCCRRRCSSSMPTDPAPPEIHLPLALSDADTEMLEGWLTDAGRTTASGSWCRSAARSAACSTSPRATRRSAYQARFNENVAAHYDALETLRAVLALPADAAPHRVLRHLDDPGQRDRGVDGRLRRRPDEAVGVSEVQDPGCGARRSGLGTRPDRAPALASPDSESAEPASASSPAAPLTRRLRLHARSRPAALSQAARDRRAVSRPDPDRRRQGAAVGRLRGARGARARRTWWRSASPRRKSCSSRAIARSRSRCARDSPALLLIQRIRDEAHRFAVTFHRQSRGQTRDLRSELDEIGGHRPAPAQGAADRLRQPRRRAPRHARGAGRGGRRQGGRRGPGALRDRGRDRCAALPNAATNA